MNKFKVWHLAVISVAVFLAFGLIAAIVIANNSDFRSPDNWNIFWKSGKSFFGKSEDYSIDEKESISISEKSNISISSLSSKVNVFQTDGEEITVHLYGTYASTGGAIELEVEDDGSEAKIVVKYPSGGASISLSNLILDVNIPKSYSEDVYVKTVSGEIDLECEDAIFEKVKLRSTSGRINFHTLSAESLDVSSTSGKITGNLISGKLVAHGTSSSISVTGLTSESEITTVSGKITVDIEKYEDMDISSTSGRVIINLETEGDFFIDYSTVSGNFNCDIPLTVENQKRTGFEGYSGDKNSAKFKVHTVSGSLEINKNY